MKAEIARQASATATTKPTTTALERALLDELAALRAQGATQTTSTNGSDSKVAEHMVREALYRREPFRATLDRNRAKLKGFAEGLGDDVASLNILYKEFALAARGGGLDPRDAVLLHGLLAPTAFRIKLARTLLINNSSQTRAAFFNTLVLDEAPSTFEDAYGEVVSQIPWPLFPVRPEFSELNTDLLREATAIIEASPTVRGAGPTLKKKLPKVFAQDREQSAQLAQIIRGSGYALVTDGKADLSEVEAAFNYQASEIADLRSQAADLRSQVQSLAAKNKNLTSQSNNNRGRGADRGNADRARGDRGRARGDQRGRGRYRGYDQYDNYNYNYRVRGAGSGEEEDEEGNLEGGF